MFSNLLPGQGLGFTGSKEIAFGLAPLTTTVIDSSVVGGGGSYYVSDNAYSKPVVDNENDIAEILSILFKVIR